MNDLKKYYDYLIETEPKNFKFIHEGYECEITRHEGHIHLCGYVYIPKGHEYFEIKDYDYVPINCHGGLTYLKSFDDKNKIGFDCAHGGDYSYPSDIGIYRSFGFVISEIIKIVEQLKRVAL